MGDVGINVEEMSEQGSSSKCPECQSKDVSRIGDEFRCYECELEAHSDVIGAWNLLQEKEGSMARPAVLRAGRRRNVSQASLNSSVGEGSVLGYGMNTSGDSIVLRNVSVLFPHSM